MARRPEGFPRLRLDQRDAEADLAHLVVLFRRIVPVIDADQEKGLRIGQKTDPPAQLGIGEADLIELLQIPRDGLPQFRIRFQATADLLASDDARKPLLLRQHLGKKPVHGALGLRKGLGIGGKDGDPPGMKILCLRCDLGITEPPATQNIQQQDA